MRFLVDFWRDDEGQDLIEYTLLIMFVAIAAAALMGGIQPATKGIWEANTNHLTAANQAF